jgi:sec-independent protein translocase protein TatA
MLPEAMHLLGFIGSIGGQELIIILLIILVLFGARKLPELARGMGQAIREFQKAKDEFSDELHSAGNADVAKKTDVRPAPAAVPRLDDASRSERSAESTRSATADQV